MVLIALSLSGSISMTKKLTEDERLRLIEIVEDELHRQQRLAKRRGTTNRIEECFMEELRDLTIALKRLV